MGRLIFGDEEGKRYFRGWELVDQYLPPMMYKADETGALHAVGEPFVKECEFVRVRSELVMVTEQGTMRFEDD